MSECGRCGSGARGGNCGVPGDGDVPSPESAGAEADRRFRLEPDRDWIPCLMLGRRETVMLVENLSSFGCNAMRKCWEFNIKILPGFCEWRVSL